MLIGKYIIFPVRRWGTIILLIMGALTLVAALASCMVPTSQPHPTPSILAPGIISPTVTPQFETPPSTPTSIPTSTASPWLTPTLETAALSTATTSITPTCVITVEFGGLISEFQTVLGEMPGPDSDGMAVPTNEQMAAWELLVQALAGGDIPRACDLILANSFPYHVVQFIDYPNDQEQVLVLKEITPITTGWGTYVFRLQTESNVIVEVPHPIADDRTTVEGVEIFRAIRARALLVAGTHRCANSTYSPCEGRTTICGALEGYRSSDVAHAPQTMFQAAHRALVECKSQAVAIQLHGNDLAGCPDLFVSNGTLVPGTLTFRLEANARKRCSDYSVEAADGISASGTQPECAFYSGANVQAAFSNGCWYTPAVDACTNNLPHPSIPEHFLSLEQSMPLRKDYECLLEALKDTFGIEEK